jgi:hypothetical protein
MFKQKKRLLSLIKKRLFQVLDFKAVNVLTLAFETGKDVTLGHIRLLIKRRVGVFDLLNCFKGFFDYFDKFLTKFTLKQLPTI